MVNPENLKLLRPQTKIKHKILYFNTSGALGDQNGAPNSKNNFIDNFLGQIRVNPENLKLLRP